MTQLNPSPYSVRPATPDDIDALVHHRISMFIEMGLSLDVPAVGLALRAWLAEKIPAETYRAWVVEADRTVVAGAGMAILPWPPGPQWLGGRIGFVSSVLHGARASVSRPGALVDGSHPRLVSVP